MLGGKCTNFSLFHASPVQVWWWLYEGIGLNGGDNTQYVNFEFYESDYNSSALEAEWGMDTYNWVSQFQSETEWGTMTAYIAHEVLASYMLCNIDGASQYFNVAEYSWHEAP